MDDLDEYLASFSHLLPGFVMQHHNSSDTENDNLVGSDPMSGGSAPIPNCYIQPQGPCQNVLLNRPSSETRL
jgi:hypothetical protein